MQVTPDIYALGFILKAFIAIPLFLCVSLIFLKIIDLVSSRLHTLVRYLAFPGVVLHEVCHDLLCRITGIPVLEHRIFIKTHKGVCNGLVMDTQHIRTFTTGFLVGFAPLIILALSLYFFITFWTQLPMHEILKCYFVFCFFIGLAPSKTDLQIVSSIVKDHPRQTLLELSLISLPFFATIGYLFIRSLWLLPFSLLVFSGVFLVGVLVSFLLWRLLKQYRNS
ncbi:MAG: hypothetical protein ACFE89_11195 [Candidatus Hodarchaeota archaeon]